MNRGKDKNLLFQNYKALLYFAWDLVMDKEQAEDLVQDAFVAFWKNKELVSANEQVIKAFLYSSIRNVTYNLYRKEKTEQKYFSRIDRSEMDDIDYEHKIIRAEFMAAVHKIASTLPTGCQNIFKLSYLDGLSNKEIADQLNISVNTVKTQKLRAIRQLKKELNPEFFALFSLYLTQ